MNPFSSDLASSGPSEGRKRLRPNDFHNTGHGVRRLRLDPSAELLIDELPTVSDVAPLKWMQNGTAVASHALENNMPDVQTSMKDKAVNWPAMQDLTVSSCGPSPGFNIGVTNESMQPELGSWLSSSRAGDINTSTKFSYWNSEYEYAPLEAHHTAFDNNPDTAGVAYNPDTDGSWSGNLCQLIFDDAIHPAIQFPSQPAPSSQKAPIVGASINENNPLSPFTAHLMSKKSCEVTSDLSSVSSPAVTAVVQHCSASAVTLVSKSRPDLGCATLSESLEYGGMSLRSNLDRNTAECDLCLGVVGVSFSLFLEYVG
jgi:hypothetical protein